MLSPLPTRGRRAGGATLKRLGAPSGRWNCRRSRRSPRSRWATPSRCWVDDAVGADQGRGDAGGVDAAVRRGGDPASLAKLTTRRIEKLIYPVSFYRNKAVHVKETARILLADFGGVVPTTMEELLTLPGVGRKTANLTLHRRAAAARQHLRRHARASHRQPLRLGADAHARADRACPLRGGAAPLVGHDQPAPRHLGPARLPADLPVVPTLPGDRPVPANRGRARRQIEAGEAPCAYRSR